MARSWCALVLLVMSMGASAVAAASVKDLPFSAAEVFPAAVRFLRVERDFPIVEKDRDNGYVIFTYQSPAGVKSRGTFEVVERGSEKEPRCLVSFGIAGAPAYLVDELHAGLRAKLRAERGR